MSLLDITSRIYVQIDRSDFDDNGHLNNAAYAPYFEPGRKDLIRLSGLDVATIKQKGIAFFMRDHSYTHKKQVIDESPVEIRSRFGKYDGKMRIHVSQEMSFNGAIYATASAEYIFTDLKSGKPIKPPEWIISRF